MKMRFLGATAGLGLLLSQPALAQTAAPTAPAPAAPAPPAPAPIPVPIPLPVPVRTVDADPALWVVKDKDTTIYLFGTIHVLKPGLRWFDEAVKTAFNKSAELRMEMPLPDPAEAQQVTMPLAMATDGKPLTEKLPEAKRAAYAAVLTKLGLPPAALDQFQPWFAAVVMSQIAVQKLGYAGQTGVEMQLDAAAKANKKPVSGFETLQEQLGFFATLPQAHQISFLVESVDEFDTFESTITRMVDRWSKGDPDGLERIMNESTDHIPALYKVLLHDRNVRWATWIEGRMKQPGTVFVAVGAGHLAGKDSVQAQLAKRKLRATRIAY